MTTDRPDPYSVLGVAPNATQAEIDRAYRALLRQHHPDTRAVSDERQSALSDQALQRVLAAHEILGDPALRAAYDREVRPRVFSVRQPAQHRVDHDVGFTAPPIVAGPVRWHRPPDPPSR